MLFVLTKLRILLRIGKYVRNEFLYAESSGDYNVCKSF